MLRESRVYPAIDPAKFMACTDRNVIIHSCFQSDERIGKETVQGLHIYKTAGLNKAKTEPTTVAPSAIFNGKTVLYDSNCSIENGLLKSCGRELMRDL